MRYSDAETVTLDDWEAMAPLTHLDRKTLLLAVAATLGFGFLQGARLLDLNTGPYSPHPYALVGLVVDGATFIVVALLSYFGRIDKARPLFLAAIVTSTVSLALTLFGGGGEAAALGKQVSAGMGWALSILCWMEVFTSYRPRYALPMIALAFAIDTLIQPLASFLFPEGRHVVLLVVFALSMVALLWCLRNNAHIAQSMQEPDAPETSMAEVFSRTRRAVAGTFAFSLICGFVIQIDLRGGLQYAQTDLTAVFSVLVALAMFATVLILKPRQANIDYFSPIAALCLVSVLLYRSLDFSDAYAAGALMVTFLMSFYVLLWLMLISEAHERKLPAFFLLGLALGVARLSVALGRFVAQLLMDQMALDAQTVFIGAVWLLVVALCLIFFSYLRYAAKLRNHLLDEAPDEPVRTTGQTVSASCALLELRKTFHLTQREYEILCEYAAGRSARHIADQFVLSEHTVKTHLRHAYAKMDVHSRQELLDLIEDVAGSPA